jgi:arylsulfatase A-like enzyme
MYSRGSLGFVDYTDQERAIQHFPKGWAERNLPGLQRLKRNGLVFENAFTNACMCSPSRATLLTGFMPSQHQVRYTLESDMPAAQYPQVELSTGLKNIASVMASVGYNVVWKGKFHLTKAPTDAQGDELWSPADLAKYGFARWNPKDSGANQDLDEGGGNPLPTGEGDNDERYMTAAGDVALGQEGVLAYLNSVAATQQPFFLVVSLVNPHDVLFYPKSFDSSGYPDQDLSGAIQRPGTADEDLSRKPTAQGSFKRIMGLSGELLSPVKQRRYLNFYADLLKSADAYLVQVLDALQSKGLLDTTLVVRTSDHGEMGMAHGGLRQKNFNAYEETLRIPLVYSNPKLFPKPRTSPALVSHVDFLPTLASLFGAPSSARADWTGRDYSRLVLDPKARAVQDYVLFTYDDFQAGQKSGPYTRNPNHITAIREVRWKLARYADPSGGEATEWELYDLRRDPLERVNIARPGHPRTAAQDRELRRLKAKLARAERTRLDAIPGTPVQLSLSASTRQVQRSGDAFTDKGKVTGTPVGSSAITLAWQLHPASSTGTVQITITGGAGSLKATGRTTYAISGNDITLTGTADITAGTGAFKGLRGKGLAFRETDTLNGNNGQITLSGTAAYT